MSFFVRPPVEAEGLLAVRSVWNNGLGAAILEPLAQWCAVIGFVTEKLLGDLGTADQPFGRGTVVCVAAGQEDGKKTAFSICDCVDFRIAPASRATNCLLMFPLFAPEAERCALI